MARNVILGGDPGRIEKIATYLDDSEKVADHRGFVTYTGKYNGIEISASCHGIGAPSAAIVFEELSEAGAENFIRVGTTGAIQARIGIGDLIIPEAAIRGENLASAYVDKEYPAAADIGVTRALVEAASNMDVEFLRGVVLTEDAFHASRWDKWADTNALSVEMECSAIFTLSRLRGLRAGGILTVDGNLPEGTKKSEFEPEEGPGDFDNRVIEGIGNSIEISLEAFEILRGR